MNLYLTLSKKKNEKNLSKKQIPFSIFKNKSMYDVHVCMHIFKNMLCSLPTVKL